MGLESLRILLVDDEPLVMRMIAKILSDLGFNRVQAAKTPQEAIPLAKSFAPNVVLSDIRMGDSNGFDFVAELRTSNYDMLRVPVIFLTGHADPEFVAKAKEMRAAGYLLKPVDPVKLKANLQRVYANLLALGELKNAPGRLV